MVIGIEYNDTEYDEDAGVISVCAVIKNGQIKRDVEVYLNVDEGLTSGMVSRISITWCPVHYLLMFITCMCFTLVAVASVLLHIR